MMSDLLLTVAVLLVGVVSYSLMKRLVTPVRLAAACVLMALIGVVAVKNREMIARQGDISRRLTFLLFSDEVESKALNPGHDPEPVVYEDFSSISKEDHDFLDEILKRQSQDEKLGPAQAKNFGKAKIVGVRRAELVRIRRQ
jgi:hypothetical protein